MLSYPATLSLWASPAPPGSTHDLAAARTHGTIDALASANITVLADKACLGAPDNAHVPYRGSRWRALSTAEKTADKAHARLRAIDPEVIATSGEPAPSHMT
ncbi:transposase family protein [Catenuloplanes indicus]|uniref:DDE Tnp4 domain-containing protein n=1 Tax=Catenuloplanes indicus TaxID=137267 RepID=A0AAE3VW57_9ACTN|nr:transposase family protein [Catenuloplanes indicus]MDQ0364775.1 hypothetical protein [Catenuloplanes indicus]